MLILISMNESTYMDVSEGNKYNKLYSINVIIDGASDELYVR